LSASRPSWDRYFMDMAVVAARRSTCNRLQVGCVLVLHEHVIATGFNGAPRGLAHCSAEACNAANRCTNTVHAEANALAQCAKHGHRVDGSTAYVTHLPCDQCCGLLINAGVQEIVYGTPYTPSRAVAMTHAVAVLLRQLTPSEIPPKLTSDRPELL
jgi:dCMP deaminase